MTQRQMLKKLIPHYSKVITLCKKEKSYDIVFDIVEKHYVDFGICRAASRIFGATLDDLHWVYENTNSGSYWYSPPLARVTTKGIIAALQYRLDKMNKILSTLK